MKTIAFVGSNSSKSINKQLTLALLKDFNEIEFLDIQNWNVPLFSEDIERNEGFPTLIIDLTHKILEADRIIITVNEHNANVSAFMKNILDWLSRKTKNVFTDKNVLIFSTSNGQRGGLSANEYTVGFCQRNGASIVQGITFPAFSQNFNVETQQIIDSTKKQEFKNSISTFIQ